jgi:hypothetical protein
MLESQGRLEERRGQNLGNLQELTLDVSTGEFLSAEGGFTYADLYTMLGNELSVLWLTPHAAVVRGNQAWVSWGRAMEDSFTFCFFQVEHPKLLSWLAPSVCIEFYVLFFDCWQ